MIRSLCRDALRLSLRPLPIFVLVVVGALLGSLVASTQHSFHGELAGLDTRGASSQSLLSGLFLFAVCAALVNGVILAHEDHKSGFVSQLAVRPVSRVSYVLGRGLGLLFATTLSTLVMVIAAIAFSGFARDELPELRSIRRPAAVEVDGRKLSRGDVAVLESEKTARFRFDVEGSFRGELRLDIQLPPVSSDGDGFDGVVDFVARVEVDGKTIAERIFDRVRPVGSVPIEFPEVAAGVADIVIENRSVGAGFVVTHDVFHSGGSTASPIGQGLVAIVFLILAAAVVAALGFTCGTIFSVGPAALVASFVLLLALAKETVLDLAASAYPRLVPALRVVPDLTIFDASESFGRGEALGFLPIGVAVLIALAWIAGSFGLSALALSWRDRS